MSIPDDRRQELADDTADLATALANALVVLYVGGTLLDRMREMTAPDLPAANLDGNGGGSDISRPTERVAITHLERGDDVAAAVQLVAEFDQLLVGAHGTLQRLTTIAARFMTRPAKAAEAELASLEEANRDAGCESCARITTSGGQQLWVKTWRTGRVASKPTDGDADGERRRTRPFMAGAEDQVEAKARLDRDTGLCQGCYEQIRRRVSPGACVPLTQALPLKMLRARLAAAVPKAG